MRESLDVWYQRELDFFRISCDEFAERFPKIAARLSLGTKGVSDPHVERLIQAFAFLNARTRLKLEDSFPGLWTHAGSVVSPYAAADTVDWYCGDDAGSRSEGAVWRSPRASGYDAGFRTSAGDCLSFRTSYR